MASISIEIGAISASVTADNTKASNIVNAYANAIGATGTNNQRAQQVLAGLIKHMREEAARHRINETTITAIAGINNELANLQWE